MKAAFYMFNERKVRLHGIFQFSNVIGESYMVGGHPGGVIAYPVAIIEHENGMIEQVNPTNLSKHSDKKEATK